MGELAADSIFAHNPRRLLRVILTFGSLLAFLLLALWALFSYTGQVLDQAGLDLAMRQAESLGWVNNLLASSISITTVALAAAAMMLIAATRGRFALAARVAVMIVGANLMTQVLKTYVLHRPYLGVGFDLPNSFPSGHTTLLMSLALALVVVLPREIRTIAGFIASIVVAGLVLSIVVIGWHRPLDVVGGILVAFMWTAALAPQEHPSPRTDRLNTVSLMASVIVLFGVVAVFALRRDKLMEVANLASLGIIDDSYDASARLMSIVFSVGVCAMLVALVFLTVNTVVYLMTGRNRT